MLSRADESVGSIKQQIIRLPTGMADAVGGRGQKLIFPWATKALRKKNINLKGMAHRENNKSSRAV
jgi:hypothetical protein